MTVRQDVKFELGNYLRNRRESLGIGKSRQSFIDDRSKTYFNNDEWISEKTLANYENGRNIPSLETLPKLALALEIDTLDLLEDILKLI